MDLRFEPDLTEFITNSESPSRTTLRRPNSVAKRAPRLAARWTVALVIKKKSCGGGNVLDFLCPYLFYLDNLNK